MTKDCWPHWLPKPMAPLIRLHKEKGEYLLANRSLINRGVLVIQRFSHKPNHYYWRGAESELNALLRYFD